MGIFSGFKRAREQIGTATTTAMILGPHVQEYFQPAPAGRVQRRVEEQDQGRLRRSNDCDYAGRKIPAWCSGKDRRLRTLVRRLPGPRDDGAAQGALLLRGLSACQWRAATSSGQMH